jgi:LysR family transcriptional regulator, low CO2-responsive transcriptional regulator
VTLDSRITLQKLEVFCTVVEFGSVRAAADHLYVSQPVVTTHIRSLEERLGAALFYREGRRLRLTEAGQTVHSWARDVLTSGRDLARRLDGLSSGSEGDVVVGASMSIGSYVLPAVLARFKREQADAGIKLTILDSDRAILATEAGECDFSVVLIDEEPRSRSIKGEHLGEEELIVIAAPDGEPRSDLISTAELGSLTFVEAPKEMIRHAIVDRQLRKVGVSNRLVGIECGHPEAMKRAVQSGLGVTLLFRTTVQDELASGELREIKLADASFSIPFYLIYHKAKLFSALQRALMDVIRQELRARAVA